MKDLKPYVDYLLLSGIKKEEGLNLLKSDNTLTGNEKNAIYCYCYPRQLLDRELPVRIQAHRKKLGLPERGTLIPTYGESILIVEAFRTEQYGRFIRHLIHSFSDPNTIFPIEGEKEDECSICGNVVYEHELWKNRFGTIPEEQKNKQFLAFGSEGSSIILCRNCLAQLIKATEILESINPDYLDWKKESPKSIKRTWEDLKL